MKKWLILSLFPLFLLSAPRISFWDAYTAALRGDIQAQYQSAVMLENGAGVDKNEASAAKLYEKAAIAGHKDAQFNLGLMYASGRGDDAFTWIQAVEKDGSSFENLGKGIMKLENISMKLLIVSAKGLSR